MKECVLQIQQKLFNLADSGYKDFQSKLMPTVPSDKIIGVRTPLLRKLARELKGSSVEEEFLKILPHSFYEENNLHAFLIEQKTDFTDCINSVLEFLPYVDNWATCDSLNPKVFLKNTERLTDYAYGFLESEDTYTVRYGIGILMRYFLDEKFKPQYAEKVISIRSNEYYVNMMRAWYFATALSKQYSDIIIYFENKALDVWTHNKAIQKAIESYRINDRQKTYLRTLKVK